MSGDHDRTRRRLDIATNIFMIVACVVLSAGIAQRAWRLGGRPTPRTTQVFQVGERITPPAGLRFNAHSRTVLLYLSSRCKYCTDSMPYYEQLASRMGSDGFNIVALGAESKDSLIAYLREHNVSVADVVSVTPGTFRAAPTPTVVVVDSNGVVEGSWTGLLGNREAEVNRALDTGN